HLRIDPLTGSAADGLLYSTEVVETLGAKGLEWAIGLDFALPDATRPFAKAPAMLGGQRRVVHGVALPPAIFEMPGALEDAFSQSPAGLRLVTLSPAIFERGWMPDGFEVADDETLRGHLPGLDEELVLRAACVPRAEHVSGWDIARRRSKQTRRLVA